MIAAMQITQAEFRGRIYTSQAKAVATHRVLCRRRCGKGLPCQGINKFSRQLDAASIAYDMAVAEAHRLTSKEVSR